MRTLFLAPKHEHAGYDVDNLSIKNAYLHNVCSLAITFGHRYRVETPVKYGLVIIDVSYIYSHQNWCGIQSRYSMIGGK